ncbi:MAG: hypothetical protein NTX63_05410 [Candidatus Peregrinibacteria bacterium]|nr:hypothetical protein [Candidatus Peregrinibacteria bacterium]
MALDRPSESGISVRATALLTCVVVGVAALGAKVTADDGPGPRKKYTGGTEEVNRLVNDVLVPRIEAECLSTGRLNVEKFKRERKEILGDKEQDVRALCRQVKESSDRVFTLQLENKTGFTRDGKIYNQTGNIATNKNK